jgi:hypothetical protein
VRQFEEHHAIGSKARLALTQPIQLIRSAVDFADTRPWRLPEISPAPNNNNERRDLALYFDIFDKNALLLRGSNVHIC